ncbi:CarD family transcriptional regulator [Bacillus massiliigorillae]|uniref:CarD family transcriptional regulator n=1 Tax=Bacillus massiliigorillae TaxID=1243664 RepID=UPI00039B2AA2|nr:CarD family transcriptional regulator [Bacillus massiliigorillae]
MFQIGDSIVYPLHGAGVIEAIEKKEVLGEFRQYFVIKLSINNLQIMIPIENIAKLGLRPVSEYKNVEFILEQYLNGETDQSIPVKERFRLNTEKIKTGKIADCIEVVRDLSRIEGEKSLNSSEKQLLNKARAILMSELVLIDGITEKQIKQFS